MVLNTIQGIQCQSRNPEDNKEGPTAIQNRLDLIKSPRAIYIHIQREEKAHKNNLSIFFSFGEAGPGIIYNRHFFFLRGKPT